MTAEGSSGPDRSPVQIPLLDPLLRGLQESSAVAAFLDAMAVPAMIVARRGRGDQLRILTANRAFEGLCGFDTAELVGESPKLFQGEDTDFAAARAFCADVETDGKAFTTLINYRKDGMPYEVFLLGARLEQPQDDDTALFATFAFHLADIDTVLPRPPIERQPGRSS